MVRCWLLSLTLLLGVVASSEDVDPETAYLQWNAGEEGVVTLPSGVQYKVLESHAEGAKGPPPPENKVKCHYEARLVNGTIFDSSYTRGKPQEFMPKSVCKGWEEVLYLMHVGDVWEVAIPSELAYGRKGLRKSVPPNSTLIFNKLQLVSIAEKEDWQDWMLVEVFSIGPLVVTRMLVVPFFVALLLRSLMTICSGPATYCRARHLVTKTERECFKALSRINKGEDFSEVAREVSTCSSAKKGGSLGKFARDIMPPEIDKLCFDKKTEVGKVKGPMKTEFGYHLVIVDQRVISEEDELAEMKEAEKAQSEAAKKKR